MDIIIKNLCKSYDEKLVLDNLNAVIKNGETVCLMGQSGAGKTTMLNILLGFENPDSGEVLNLPEIKSAVFQENRLCENFSVYSNIKMANSGLSDEIISQHLEAVGLGAESKSKVNTLSGGMKRRAALVRAVLAPKDILFLDEPFKGLDEDTKAKVSGYLKENIKNITTIMVTHDIDEATALGARVLYLDNGKVTE